MRFEGSVAGGRCAQHPDRASQATCARCGGFMCATCGAGGAEALCPPCRQRVGTAGFPFHRGDFNFERLWGFTFEAWKKQWVMLSVAVLALGGVYLVGSFVLQLFIGGGTAVLARANAAEGAGAMVGVLVVFFCGLMLLLLAVGVGFLGLLRMFSDALVGRPADFAALFGQFSKLGRAVVLLLLMGAIVLVPTLVVGGAFAAVAAAVGLKSGEGGPALVGGLLALAGAGYLLVLVLMVWLTLPFTFAMLELVHTEAPAVECLRRGYALSTGYRWHIFLYRLFGGLLSTLGVMACCVGLLPAFALAQMLETSLYLAVRNGSGLPPLEL